MPSLFDPSSTGPAVLAMATDALSTVLGRAGGDLPPHMNVAAASVGFVAFTIVMALSITALGILLSLPNEGADVKPLRPAVVIGSTKSVGSTPNSSTDSSPPPSSDGGDTDSSSGEEDEDDSSQDTRERAPSPPTTSEMTNDDRDLHRAAAPIATKDAATSRASAAAAASSAATATKLRSISYSELASHSTPSSPGGPWIAIHGKVYDVSSFHAVHPGGDVLLAYAGMEAGDQFEMFHEPKVRLRLRRLLIGTLEEATTTTKGEDDVNHADVVDVDMTGSKRPNLPVPSTAAHHAGDALGCTLDYRALREEMWDQGLYKPDYHFYAIKIVINLCLFVCGIAVLIGVPPAVADEENEGGDPSMVSNATYATLARWVVAPTLLALTIQQWGFVAHDSLHNCLLAHPRRGRTWQRKLMDQLSGGIFMGISAGMWLQEHNEHHAYTIRPGTDPQFFYAFLWLQNFKELPFWEKMMPSRDGGSFLRKVLVVVATVMIRVQHVFIVPIVLCIGRYAFLLNCWIFAVKNRCWADLAAMVLHWSWYLSILFTFYPTPLQRAAFVALHFSICGVQHVQLLISHLCMEQFTSEEEMALGVFQFQLLTTRNVESHWYSHWFHGGLELQIEHHLFPMLPRHRLRDVRPRVQEIAAKHGIPYVEVGFVEGVKKCFIEDLGRIARCFATADFF